jgi:hypothetical protein
MRGQARAYMRALARAGDRMGARACEGLSPGGPGGRSGLVSGGAGLRDGQAFGVLGSWKLWQFVIISRKL